MTVSSTFTRRRRMNMAGEVAKVIRLAFAAGRITTLFGLEGALQAALRADLCLRGWHWVDAHQAATDIVEGAHSLLGADRPDWYEGQPEYVIAGGVLIARTRCKRCHKKLPEGRLKFCSGLCSSSEKQALAKLRLASSDRAADLAVHMVRRVQ
ncbi:hypothetical protein [uncultured Roseobacter sp.]|uniref:hypothetical protein n=1 Tax=uncultured Roseobacter sp. TaxID=114847 RepID=UPI002606A1AC|nr:hypothetical protein [uncultured Roseobacter sp.]